MLKNTETEQDNPIIQNQYKMINDTLNRKKPQVLSKQAIKLNQSIKNVISKTTHDVEKEGNWVSDKDLGAFLNEQRQRQADLFNKMIGKELKTTAQKIKTKREKMRKKHNALLRKQVQDLSDEQSTSSEDEVKLTKKQQRFLNEKFLGYQRQYIQDEEEEEEEQSTQASDAPSPADL